MSQTTRQQEFKGVPEVLYLSFELGCTEWKLAFTVGRGEKPRLRTLAAGDRPAFPKGAKTPSDEDLTVEYKAGGDTVSFGFSIPGTPEDAREGVKFTREEAVQSKVDRKGEQYSFDGDPSYYKTAKFMSWSRGGYFFYADASSPAALDRFMKAFPF